MKNIDRVDFCHSHPNLDTHDSMPPLGYFKEQKPEKVIYKPVKNTPATCPDKPQVSPGVSPPVFYNRGREPTHIKVTFKNQGVHPTVENPEKSINDRLFQISEHSKTPKKRLARKTNAIEISDDEPEPLDSEDAPMKKKKREYIDPIPSLGPVIQSLNKQTPFSPLTGPSGTEVIFKNICNVVMHSDGVHMFEIVKKESRSMTRDQITTVFE